MTTHYENLGEGERRSVSGRRAAMRLAIDVVSDFLWSVLPVSRGRGQVKTFMCFES